MKTSAGGLLRFDSEEAVSRFRRRGNSENREMFSVLSVGIVFHFMRDYFVFVFLTAVSVKSLWQSSSLDKMRFSAAENEEKFK